MSEAKRLKGMDMLEELECHVCFEIPRQLPIPACPKGHIVFKTCRENVKTCPTCRADFRPGGVNIPVRGGNDPEGPAQVQVLQVWL